VSNKGMGFAIGGKPRPDRADRLGVTRKLERRRLPRDLTIEASRLGEIAHLLKRMSAAQQPVIHVSMTA